ncbi:MAG: hypothetical protein NT084_13715 [Bacteroidetes bacterium]|jgi:hypothetical protein|nr:hypothetical protein [Bacteroidota bacterium]
MKKPHFSSILFFALISIWTISCNENSENNSKKEDSATIDVSQEVVSAENVFVYVPSPIETASLLKDAGAKYNPDFLNLPSNVSRYSSTASRALNLGVYGTDLAFAGIFDQHAETMLFMDCTGKLADALHVSSAFSADRNTRLEGNMNNRDSVLSIITDSYWDCDALLHENHQTQASALMIAGGWIEGLYLACKVAETTNSNDIRIRIAEQGSSLDKLVALLDKQNHIDTKPIAEELKKLKMIFDALPKNTNASPNVSTDNKTGVTTIGDDNSIPKASLNELEFQNILKQVTLIRSGIIKLN